MKKFFSIFAILTISLVNLLILNQKAFSSSLSNRTPPSQASKKFWCQDPSIMDAGLIVKISEGNEKSSNKNSFHPTTILFEEQTIAGPRVVDKQWARKEIIANSRGDFYFYKGRDFNLRLYKEKIQTSEGTYFTALFNGQLNNMDFQNGLFENLELICTEI